jgi:hypothetical protein
MAELKHLISPFATHSHSHHSPKKATPRQVTPCNCDSDDENDFGMAHDCAFVCNAFTSSSLLGNKGKNKSKKRGIKHAKTRTKRNKH